MGVCSPWLDIGDVVGCTADDFPEGLLADALELANDLLYDRTGRQWPGLCTDTVRPTAQHGCAPWWQGSYMFRGSYPFGPSGGLGDRFTPEYLVLPGFPVRSVTTVKVDGVTLDASQYRLMDRRILLRVDGCWPSSQRLDLADTEDGTFSVAYAYGTAPPRSAKLPLSRFACELAKAANNQPCGLAEEITQQIRQGVTLIGLSPDQFGNRPTGIRLVDNWVDTKNPHGLRQRPRILSPDSPTFHR